MRKYVPGSIIKSPTMPLEYFFDPWDSSYSTIEDALAAMLEDPSTAVPLDSEDLPPEVEDIRGLIHDEPDHVFVVYLGPDDWFYVGVSEEDGPVRRIVVTWDSDSDPGNPGWYAVQQENKDGQWEFIDDSMKVWFKVDLE